MQSLMNLINNAESIYIYAHVNMDGDALGSTSALCLALRAMGKNAFTVISEAVPHNLDFLEKGCCVNPEEVPDSYDLAMMLDCGSYNRIPGREEAFDRGVKKICIDHHAMGASTIKFDAEYVDADAAATGELIYKLIKELGVEITLDIAECLWTAIATDTGNFQHNSTSAFTHEMAAELHRIEGFDSSKLSALIYQRRSVNAMMLESKVLSDVRMFADNRIAIAAATIELLDATGCDYSDADAIINTLRNLDGIEIAVVLKESESGLYKASMRAKSYANVAEVAVKFGGGGHIRAAGCPLNGTLDEVIAELSNELVKAVC